jgi:protein HOOK3
VNEDKAELEADVDKLKKQNKDLNEKNRMQLEQINGLLMEKMNLQTEGIGHREKLLLQRDLKCVSIFQSIFTQLNRDSFSNELNSVLPGNVPEEFRQRWLSIHEDNIAQKETIKGLNEKLVKARQVSRQTGVYDLDVTVFYFCRSSNFKISSSRMAMLRISLLHQ